jgi:hypothetical protein
MVAVARPMSGRRFDKGSYYRPLKSYNGGNSGRSDQVDFAKDVSRFRQ